MKTLDTSYKNRSGIYQIRNTLDGKVYIGRSKCLYRRSQQYKHAFRYKKSHEINSYLMSSMLKYGFENFSFEPVEFCEPHETPEKEVYWIKNKNTTDRKIGYNLKIDCPGSIYTSKETKDKIARAISNKWNEVDFREKMQKKLSQAWLRDEDRKLKHIQESRKRNTKWKYFVTCPDQKKFECIYSGLIDAGLEGVYSRFSAKRKNKVYYRGYIIERSPLCLN